MPCGTPSTRRDAHGLAVHGWCADLTVARFPRRRSTLIVVDALPAARSVSRSLTGALDARRRRSSTKRSPRRSARTAADRPSPDHLLKPGELPRACARLEMLFYEEVDEPEALGAPGRAEAAQPLVVTRAAARRVPGRRHRAHRRRGSRIRR